MYHPTEMTNAIIPTSWFYSLFTPNQTQRDYPSRLEISFLLDGGASIPVFNTLLMLQLQNFLILKQSIHKIRLKR